MSLFSAFSSFLFVLIAMHASAADVLESQRYRDIVIRAQCQARCLSVFGSETLFDGYASYNLYQPYNCLKNDFSCRQCLNACEEEFSSVQRCKVTCKSHACIDSCIHAFNLKSNERRTNELENATTNLHLSIPELHCQGVSVLNTSYIYVRWNVVDNSQRTPNDTALMFVVSTADSVLGKSHSNLIPLKHLQLDSIYRLYVTAVSADGVVDIVKSSLLTTLKDWTAARSPVNVTARSGEVMDGSLSAVVQWIPDSSSMSCFYKLFWMSRQSSSQGYKIFSLPLSEWQYRMSRLEFGEKYDVKIFAYDPFVSPEYESSAASTWFLTPDCLSAMNNNLTLCAPPAVLDFVCEKISSELNKTASARISWTPLNIFGDFHYLLEWKKRPALFDISAISHYGNFTVNKTETNISIAGLHQNSMYKFYIFAVSLGGTSEATSITVATGFNSFGNSAKGVLEEKTVPEIKKAAGSLYLYLLLVCVIFVPVIIYIIYRKRLSKNLPTLFDMSLSELNYLMDDSLIGELDMELSSLTLGEEIGSGAFGRVFKATVRNASNLPEGLWPGMTVAVKTLKEFASREDEASFIKEMHMMKHLGQHPCIVSMLGCCAMPPGVCIVLDYSSKGDLRRYLWTLRDIECSADQDHKLLSFARQIAIGMEYLAQKKFVHRDLAARNVLVCDNDAVKISDFGLTRDVYENSVYQKNGGGKLPLKWMAVESIFDQTYTTQSDVWSFGVVLWEIVTLGASPYPGISTADLLSLLKDGKTMDKPDNCSEFLYELMLKCWCISPSGRPSFTSLVTQIEDIMAQSANYLKLNHETEPWN